MASWKHGGYSAEAIKRRREARELPGNSRVDCRRLGLSLCCSSEPERRNCRRDRTPKGKAGRLGKRPAFV